MTPHWGERSADTNRPLACALYCPSALCPFASPRLRHESAKRELRAAGFAAIPKSAVNRILSCLRIDDAQDLSVQASGEEADAEEDLEVANRNLRAALDASQQEVFEVYQQVSDSSMQGSLYAAITQVVCHVSSTQSVMKHIAATYATVRMIAQDEIHA